MHFAVRCEYRRGSARTCVYGKGFPELRSTKVLQAANCASHRRVRYVVYDPKDPRKGQTLADPELGQILLGEGATITKALAAAGAHSPLPRGAVVWDRQQTKIAYRVP